MLCRAPSGALAFTAVLFLCAAFLAAPASATAVTGVNTDPNSTTPLYLGASGQIYMTIDTSGHVGIGTSSPVNVLEVRTGTDQDFLIQSGANWSIPGNGIAVQSLNDAATVSEPLSLQGSVTLLNPLGGTVGINTTTPKVTLDVNGPVRAGTATTGAGCTQQEEGATGYDYNAHAPVYCDGSTWRSNKPSFSTAITYQFSGNGLSQGATTGLHDICAMVGVYQNGNNGWASMTPSQPNAAGKRIWTVTSTCSAQGCGAGALAITVNCFDF